MQEQHFSFQQTRRYYQSELKGKQQILIALHGYGQLAQFFFRKFAQIPENWGLLVPEGPHRFYLEGSSGRVGASWMTKEWRYQDIADNNAYLQQLIEKIQAAHPLATLHLLGFSQGGATAARLFQRYPSCFKQLILWASVFPPDIEKNDFPISKKLAFVLGKQDPYFVSEKQQNIMNEYRELGFDCYSFVGGHDIETTTLLNVLQAD
ncbi:MAG: alpha/beta hydrolase [Flavobacteriales bacterium]